MGNVSLTTNCISLDQTQPVLDSCRDNEAQNIPENFHALDEGTQEFIRNLLLDRDEARSQLKAAQTDQAIIRGQLTTVDSRVASKFLCISSLYCCSDLCF